MSSDVAETQAGTLGRRVSPGFRAAGIASVFVALTGLLEIEWERLSPVHSVAIADPRAPQLRISHEDGPRAVLTTRLDSSGLHLTGSGFRRSGLRIEIPSPPAEHDCPLGAPHTHDIPSGHDEFVVSLQARSRRPGSGLAIGIGTPTFSRSVKRQRWHDPVPLGPEWRSIRVRIDAMRPPAPALGVASGIGALVLEFDPPVAVDSCLREIRLLRVPRAR